MLTRLSHFIVITVRLLPTQWSRGTIKGLNTYRKYHIIREYLDDGLVDVCKITFEDNIANPFTKTLVARSFERHVDVMGM